MKKCRKGDVIRSQRNLGLPGFKFRRIFSEILGPFGWITASHGFGSPQKVQFFTVFLLFLTQNSHRWPKEVSHSSGNSILIVFLFLVTSLARLEAEIPIPAPSFTNPNVTPKCDDWVGRGGRAAPSLRGQGSVSWLPDELERCSKRGKRSESNFPKNGGRFSIIRGHLRRW